MKSATIIFILAIFCLSTGVAQMRNAFDWLRQLESKAEAKIRDLNRYCERIMPLDLSARLYKVNSDAMRNINKILEPAFSKYLEGTRTVSTDGANDKNAANCFGPTKQKVTEAQKKSYDGVKKCIETAESSIEPIRRKIDELRLFGREIDNSIVKIFEKCFFPLRQAEYCIFRYIPAADEWIRNLFAGVKNLKASGETTARQADRMAFACCEKVVRKFREEFDASGFEKMCE